MKGLKLFRSAVAVMAAALLVSGAASGQDTLSITGTFKMSELVPTVGADLAGVQPNPSERWWKLTLNGVSYSQHYSFWDDEYGGQYYEYSTLVHATSFAFEFFGPDAAVLNEVVSRQLTRGGLADGAFLELADVQYFDPDEWGAWGSWSLRLDPSDPATGVRFTTTGNVDWFDADALGYPVVQPQRLSWADSSIDDFRPGNGGSLRSYDDDVDLGSDQPPLPPWQITIADASVLEGNRRTTTLLMTVKLNRASEQAVTVWYQTAGGTATAGADYVAASGMVTFQPGETSKTISLSIIGDRKREPDESIGVGLGNAVGALIVDSVGVATILNDD